MESTVYYTGYFARQGWQFKRAGTNQCLNSFNSANYSKIDTWTCDINDNDQVWQNNGGGFRKNGSNFCINSNAPADGKLLIMWTCNTADNDQNWNYDWSTQRFTRNGSSPSQCIDIQTPNNLGNKVYTWTCASNNNNQKWIATWFQQ